MDDLRKSKIVSEPIAVNLLYGVAFISNFLISTDIGAIPISILSSAFICLLLFLFLILNLGKIQYHNATTFNAVAVLFFTPILLSVFATIVNTFLLINDGYSIEYLIIGFPRLFNYIVLFVAFLCFNSIKEIQEKKVIKYFYFSLLIFLFFGIWQLLNYYFDVPFVSIETRNHAHGVENNYLIKRVTSIAREPSFLSPILIELFILTIYYKEQKTSKFLCNIILWSSLVVAIFMLSPSVYIEFLILGLIVILRNKRNFWGILLIVILSLIIFISQYELIDKFFLHRIRNAGDSGRILELKSIYDFMISQNIFTFLFGLGPKSINYLFTKIKIEGSNEDLMVSSNNIFMDLFMDNGFVGVIFLVVLFAYLIKISLSIKSSNVPILLSAHFAIFNQYRGEYASLRFVMVLVILLYIINIIKKRESSTLSCPIRVKKNI